MAPPTRPTLSRAESLQRLQFLTCQQEVLRRRLNLQIPTGSPFLNSSSSPGNNSPQSSRSSSGSWSPGLTSTAYSSSTARPIPTEPGAAHAHRQQDLDASASSTHEEDTQRLYEVNQQIKATLTEMMNTESVRSDSHFRAWIQERLMDVEQQIRRQRRRHSSSDRDVARSIAEHISPPVREKRMSWA